MDMVHIYSLFNLLLINPPTGKLKVLQVYMLQISIYTAAMGLLKNMKTSCMEEGLVFTKIALFAQQIS